MDIDFIAHQASSMVPDCPFWIQFFTTRSSFCNDITKIEEQLLFPKIVELVTDSGKKLTTLRITNAWNYHLIREMLTRKDDSIQREKFAKHFRLKTKENVKVFQEKLCDTYFVRSFLLPSREKLRELDLKHQNYGKFNN